MKHIKLLLLVALIMMNCGSSNRKDLLSPGTAGYDESPNGAGDIAAGDRVESTAEAIAEEIIEIEETIAQMVTRVSIAVGIDPLVSLAVLKEENPTMNCRAVHYNKASGSRDLGLFQLNDRYIHTEFVPRYWKQEKAFDPFDAESNTFIALSHLKYLLKHFKYNIKDAVSAYNAGIRRVKTQKVPETTQVYSTRIMRTISDTREAMFRATDQQTAAAGIPSFQASPASAET